MSIGTNIKLRRFELNMSQQELASLMGYKSRSTIAKIESGENDVTQLKIRKFAEVLDTTFEALISGTESPPSNNFSPLSSQPDCSSRDRNVAVILAGGKSVRNQLNIPNQFVNILGKPVIVYCLEAYQAHPMIDDIYVVCLKGWEDIVFAYAKQFHITKLRGLIPNGSTGIQSVMNSLDILCSKYNESDLVVIQESTRPMIDVDMISKVLQASSINGSATVCQSMKDYLQFAVNDSKSDYIDRKSLVSIQSPEAYRFSRIMEIFKKAKERQHSFTESCCSMLMYNFGYNINFIEGGPYNVKIVHQEDIAITISLLKQREQL